jgi:hypothetical protein
MHVCSTIIWKTHTGLVVDQSVSYLQVVSNFIYEVINVYCFKQRGMRKDECSNLCLLSLPSVFICVLKIYADGHSNAVHHNCKSTELLIYPMVINSICITSIHTHVLLLLLSWLCDNTQHNPIHWHHLTQCNNSWCN